MTDSKCTAGTADEKASEVALGENRHLDDLPDGAGCTGIWEHLSARREADND